MKQEYAENVAAKIIEQLEQGTAPWLKPWNPGELRLPYNPKTGSEYRGMNCMWLHMQGHADPRWLTYNQAVAENAQVKKGEKGTQIVYWKFTDDIKAVDDQGQPIIDPETGKQKTITVKLERPRSFSAVVFNAEQVDGLPPLEARPIRPEPERHARAEAILTASGANIQHIEGDRAFYRPSTDSITLPLRSQFSSADAYYATALHETGHWTGHESRLDRDLNNPFGSEGYAREELRAEIASLMLGERLEIGHDPAQHVAYIGSWVKLLKEDPREIFRAAADAERITGFVMGFEHEQYRNMDHPIAVQNPTSTNLDTPKIERTYLAIPFAEKDEAKAAAKEAGIPLKWDKDAKSWYTESADLEAVAKWIPVEKSIETDEQLGHYSDQTLDALVKNHGWEVAYSDLHAAGQVDAVGRTFDGVGPLGTMNTPNGERRLLAGYGTDPENRRYLSLKLGDTSITEIDGREKTPVEAAQLINASAEKYADKARVKNGLDPIYETQADQEQSTNQGRSYLAIPFAEKDEAKAAAKEAGIPLKWDKDAKSWYTESADLEAVAKWIPVEKSIENLDAENSFSNESGPNFDSYDENFAPNLGYPDDFSEPSDYSNYPDSSDYPEPSDYSNYLDPSDYPEPPDYPDMMPPFDEPVEATHVLHHAPEPESISPSRTYLAVPFAEKDEAKAAAKEAGFQLKWDKDAKSWYAPEGANLEAVAKWRAENGNVVKDTAPKESVESQFSRALREAGLKVDGLPKMDGLIQRVPTLDDKAGALSGAYAGHLTGITAGGFIQNYKSGEVIHWKPEGTTPQLTPEERAEQTKAAQQQFDARQALKLEQQITTAKAAQTLWDEAPEATPDNQYCKAKGMLDPAASGLRVVPSKVSAEAEAQGIKIAQTAKEAKALREADPKNRVFKAGDLLVPYYDIDGKLWSLQTVNPYFKSNMKNGRKQGLFSVVGAKNPAQAFEQFKADPSFPLTIAGEGVSTADTVSRLMKNRPVILAIDSGNIDSVVQQFREREPSRLLLIATDNDHNKPNELDEYGKPKENVGLMKAQQAAEKHGAGVMIPRFEAGEKGSDWNDLAANRGDKAAQRILADEFVVAKRDAAIAADRMMSIARTVEMEARNDPTTSADDAYIAGERSHAAELIADASRHVNNVNAAISDGRISTKGTNSRAPASVKAAVNNKTVAMSEKIKEERQDMTFEGSDRKQDEKPTIKRKKSKDLGM